MASLMDIEAYRESGSNTKGLMDNISITYLLLVMLSLMCAVPLLTPRRGKPRDVFEPVYWATAYFFLLYVVRAVYDLSIGSEILGDLPFDTMTAQALNLSLLYLIPSLICFFVGYYSSIGRALSQALPAIGASWSTKRYRTYAPIFLMIGLASYYALIQYHGGLEYYLTYKQETLTAGGQEYMLRGAGMIPLLFAVALTRYLSTGKGRVMTFAILLPFILIMGFISASKGYFLIPILTIILSVHYLRKKIKLHHLAAFLLMALLVIPIFNVYRHLDDLSLLYDSIVELASSDEEELMVRHAMSRYIGIDSMTFIVRDTPYVMDYQYGKTIVPLLYSWIPRQLWEDKPIISTGKIFGETYYSEFFSGTGIAPSPTILGEAYINWHIAGMLWTAVLIGVVLRTYYEYFARQKNEISVFVYGALFPYQFTIWESGYTAYITNMAIILLSTGLFVLAMRQSRMADIENVSDRLPEVK